MPEVLSVTHLLSQSFCRKHCRQTAGQCRSVPPLADPHSACKDSVDSGVPRASVAAKMQSDTLQPGTSTEPVEQTPTQTVKRLVDLCTEVVLRSDLEPESLYQLSTVEVVELCSRVLKECQVAKEDCRTAREQLLELQSHSRYVVDPPLNNNRCDRELRDRQFLICEKWEVLDEYPTGGEWPSPAGRLVPAWDKERKMVYYAAEENQLGYSRTPGNLEYCFYKLISSSLLLYRLWCTFKVSKVQEGDGYKCIWSYFVKHKESGIWVGFGEYKAAAQVWSSRKPPTNTSFDLDWLDLLNLLLDPMCPHPYDGTVAGSVA